MKQPLQLRSAAPQRPPVFPDSKENLCNAIPALVETTAPGRTFGQRSAVVGLRDGIGTKTNLQICHL